MTTKVVPGTLIATETPAEAATEAGARMARVLRKALTDRRRACIALSGGTTPRAAYAELARQADIDWTRVEVYFVDERAVPPTSDRSNYRMVRESLLDPAGIANANVVRMEGESRDLDAAAKKYEIELRSRVPNADGIPSFDLVVFGIGSDGHTASIFPGERTYQIQDRYVVAVPAKGDREPRLTLTVPVLERARNAIVLAVGAEKKDALERAWQVKGDVATTPARVVRSVKGSVVWVIDRAAGGLT
jgi:6-phosphogluconolactonase